MSASYTYDVATETANGEVNPPILAHQIAEASYASGGTFEGVATEDGTMGDGYDITGGTITITWQNTLDGSDESAQDALVLAHQGEAFGAMTQSADSESMSSTGLDTPQTKLELVMEPVHAGEHDISLYCEIRLQSAVSGSGVRAILELDRPSQSVVEVAQDDWAEDTWHAFSASGSADLEAGEVPTIRLVYHRTGAANTVEIRRARVLVKLRP